MSPRPTLPESVEIAKFFKNRWRDKVIVVSLNPFEGKTLIAVRECFVGADGLMKPTTKGLAMAVQRLPELAKAINKALKQARELGLIDDEASEASS
jgi:pantoate kinase